MIQANVKRINKKLTVNILNKKIIECKKCPRLVLYLKKISKEKVKRFKNEEYWGKPLPSFGDPNAKLLIVGLAPAAHGGNRTGRMFTGDKSGDWLAKVLYQTGFSSQPTSEKINDGFNLFNAYVSATIHCAPPENKPLKPEIENCSYYLREELTILKNIRVIVCLGRISFDSCCKLLDINGKKFGHGKVYRSKKFIIISSYHPSRQNTQTGRLTWNQWFKIFHMAKRILDRRK